MTAWTVIRNGSGTTRSTAAASSRRNAPNTRPDTRRARSDAARLASFVSVERFDSLLFS